MYESCSLVVVVLNFEKKPIRFEYKFTHPTSYRNFFYKRSAEMSQFKWPKFTHWLGFTHGLNSRIPPNGLNSRVPKILIITE